MSNSFLNFMLIYNLCPKTNLSTGQNFSDLSTTSATYRPKYELEILSRALYTRAVCKNRNRSISSFVFKDIDHLKIWLQFLC